MKILKKVLTLLLFGLLLTPSDAQETKNKDQASFYISIGWNFLGPKLSMMDNMRTHNFEYSYYSRFLNRQMTYPKTDGITPSIGIGFSKYTASKTQLGITLKYDHFGMVRGYSAEYSYLSISFENYSLIPHFIMDIGSFELKLGTSFMFNKSYESIYHGPDHVVYNNFNIGLLAGANVIISDREKTQWKLGFDGLITYNSSLGQFPVGLFDNGSFPASKVNFSHLSVQVVLEFK